MSILHTQCLPTELGLTPNQNVIAATFNGCDGNPLTPGTELAKCVDIPAAQTLTLAGQTLSLSGGGGSVVLPDSDDQQLSISGNVISLTDGGSVTLPTTAAPVPQVLSIAGNTVSLSGGGGSVVVPDMDDQTLSISGNNLTISNGNTVALPVASTPFATPAQTIAGTSTTLAVNPADLYARENIPAQTGLGLVLSDIPAPAANESVWGQNLLGETLHYSPSLGWKIVADKYKVDATYPFTATTVPNGVFTTLWTFTAPRAGRILVTATGDATNDTYPAKVRLLIRKNTGTYTVDTGAAGSSADGVGMTASDQYDVIAGDTITAFVLPGNGTTVYQMYNVTSSITYLN